MFTNKKIGRYARRNNCAQKISRYLLLSRNKKQHGFTLLELLIVVSIIAAIAGTATLALKDTDKRAEAAVHVAIMDELNKGIRTYSALNKRTLPTRFDSLIEADTVVHNPTGNNTLKEPQKLSLSALQDFGMVTLTEEVAKELNEVGLDTLLYISKDKDPDPTGEGDCSDLQTLIKNKRNNTSVGNIFNTPTAGGCGVALTLSKGDKVLVWTGSYAQVLGGTSNATITVSNGELVNSATAGTPVLMAVGAGSGSSLFDVKYRGGMTTVPVYRHAQNEEYNRFILLFNIGKYRAVEDGSIEVNGRNKISLAAVIDGDGRTKDEELKFWDR